MKISRSNSQIIFSFIAVFFLQTAAFSQILSIDPIFPTADDTVTIIYDATEGNAALVGVSPIYAHTGVITSASTSPTDWKYVQGNWGQPDAKVLMEDLGNNLHKISYHIRSYYGNIPQSETVEKLAFVFRNADGSKVGRETDGSDIFYDVYSGGILQIAFLTPGGGNIFELNDPVEVKTAASDSANLELYLDNALVASGFGKELNYNFNATTAGNHQIKLVADNSTTIKTDSVSFFVRGPVNVQVIPSGVAAGVNYINDSTVILGLYAPFKQHVFVLGDFNNWTPSEESYMNQNPAGTFYWIEISGLTPGQEYAYQYLVDGNLKIADPYTEKVLDPWNDGFIPAVTYPNLKPYPTGSTTGIVSVLQTAQTPYQWQNLSYDRPNPEDLIVYELLIRDFIARHDYQTLIDSLDYLENLGINAIELMPVMEFEGNSSWGYNTSFLFAPDKYYGTKNDLKAFIDACHERGIVVIMDMVLNHAFGQSPLVQLYWDAVNNKPLPQSPWFNVNATHPFNVGYDFNHESADTKYFVDRVLEYWVSEYKFDGYRMDLSKGFTQVNSGGNVGQWGQYDASRIALIKRMFTQLRNVDSSVYFILEHFADNSEEKELAEAGMMTWGNHTHNYNEATMGYISNSNFEWISYQQRGWSVPHVVGYMESHDEERLMFKNITFGNSSGAYNTSELSTALDRMEMAAAFFFTIPGPKMIWQFGELGYEVSIDENGRTGEKPIRWEYLNNPDRRRLHDVYASLIDLRKNQEVFRTTDYHLSVGGTVKRIHLNHSSMNVTAVGNFGVTSTSGVPNFQHMGWWYDYISGDSLEVTDLAASVPMEAGEYHVYTDVRLSNPVLTSIDERTLSPLGVSVFPNPSSGQVSFSFDLPQSTEVSLTIFDIQGRNLGTLIENKRMPAGHNEINWNSTEMLPAEGMYLYQLKTDSHLDIGKIWITR